MLVKFITAGSNSAFGSFEAGSLLRCSPEMAKHLVEEVKCAKYMEAPVIQQFEEQQAADETQPTEAPKRGRKPKAKEEA